MLCWLSTHHFGGVTPPPHFRPFNKLSDSSGSFFMRLCPTHKIVDGFIMKYNGESSLKNYMASVNAAPRLTNDEQNRLIILAQNGDLQARNKVIESNLRLVLKISSKYKCPSLPFEDVVAEGNIGLFYAIKKYNDCKRTFEHYAYFWIKKYIVKALINTFGPIRITRDSYDDLCKYRKIEQNIFNRTGIVPSQEIVFKELQTSKFQNNRIKKAIITRIPTTEFKERTKTIVDSSESHDINCALKALGRITRRKADMLKVRFGIGYSDSHTLEETGKHFGISRERVHQIVNDAIQRLRKEMKYECV